MSDTTQIIVTILGVGIALAGLMRHDTKTLNTRIEALSSRIDAMEGRMNSRIDALRQEVRAEIASLNNRIDNLYQALFSRKDPAA